MREFLVTFGEVRNKDEFKNSDGLKPDEKARKEEGEIGEGERGSDGGETDLNLGTSSAT